MRYYISGPISGTEDYMERFEEAEKQLKDKGYSVVNPAAVNARLPEDTTYEEYMRMAMTMLEMCDGIVMLEGWRDSIGANREYGYALGTEMEIIYSGGMITMADALKPAPPARNSEEPTDEKIISEWEAEKAKRKEEKPVKDEKSKSTKKEEPEKKTRKTLDHGKIMALYKAGWSIKNIAGELGTTPNTISATLSKLKKKQKEEGDSGEKDKE